MVADGSLSMGYRAPRAAGRSPLAGDAELAKQVKEALRAWAISDPSRVAPVARGCRLNAAEAEPIGEVLGGGAPAPLGDQGPVDRKKPRKGTIGGLPPLTWTGC